MPTIRVSKSPGSSIWRLGEPITQAIAVPLPPEKVAELAHESAAATVRITELEAELAAERERIKEEQKPLEKRVQELAPIILNGTTTAPVECQWETDEHTTKVWLRRLDNGDLVKGSERAPTGDELAALRQGVIPMDVPADGPKRSRKSASSGTPEHARDQAEALFAKSVAESEASASSAGELPAFEPDGDGGSRERPRLALVSEQTSTEPPPSSGTSAELAQESDASEVPSEPAPLSSYNLPAPHGDWQLQRFPENMVRFFNGLTFVGVAEWTPGAGHWTNIEETEGETIPAQVLQAGIVAMLEEKLPEQPEQLPPPSEWLTFGDWRVCTTGNVLRFWTGTTDVATASANAEGTGLTFFRGPTIEIPEQVIRFTLNAVHRGVLKITKGPTPAPATAPGAAHVGGMRAHPEAAGAEPVSFSADDGHSDADAGSDGVEEETGEDPEEEADAGTAEQEPAADATASSENTESGGEGEEGQDGDSLTELAASALRHVKAAGAAGLTSKVIGSKSHNRRPGRTLKNLVERGYLQAAGDGESAIFTITEAGTRRLDAYEQAHQPRRSKK